MQIVIHCGGMPFNGNTIPDGESLGGSESAAYFMAKELAALGHAVICFTNSKDMGKVDGVNYQYVGQQTQAAPLGENFHTVLQVPHDVAVIQRHPMAFIRQLNTKLNIWWLHDLALIRHGSTITHHLPFTDHILTVSEFHRQQVAKIYDIPDEHITATTNGVDYGMFSGLHDNVREEKSLVFAARPERGLEEIIRPDTGLAELLPDYKFHVCTYKNVPEHMAGFYEFCWQRCAQLPNVTNHGFLGKHKLYELLSKCSLYIYPTSFEDTSNIMLLESNAVGTPFMGLADHAALPETGKGAGVYWIGVKGDYEYGVADKTNLSDNDLKLFGDKIKYVCENESKWKSLHEKALAKRQGWADAALQWQALFKTLLAKKCDDKTRLFKHLEHYSDVYCIKDAAKEQLKKNYYFMYDGDYKGHYDRYYQYEENRGVKYGPEDLTGNARFEHTAALVRDLKNAFAYKKVPFWRVLDYGCAHGHYVMNLAKRFPKLHYTGIDINQKNIDIANKWLLDFEGDEIFTENPMPEFICGEIDAISESNETEFDVIICTEVLEHVPDPVALCEQLKKHLSPNGYMIITVPYGAWEAIGYKDHPGWRAHIHQLERADLENIFETQRAYNLQGLPHSAELGHYFVTFENSDEPLGQIDYDRKFSVQAPRQTVSCCMIVKNGEHELGRTLNSIEGVYDELIVGIDKDTIDDTRRICEKYGAITIDIESPLKIGFDTARNATIGKASMDWVLWIDADETMENTKHLKKYLRPNCFNGYGIRQVHFAVEPEGVLKTDFPCRLFRNHTGFKFYGHVHEHPERGNLNDGPGKVYIIPDVAIMHTGYATEATRRRRFERNFPLMQIERQRHPDRSLGKMLWVRDLAHICKYTMEKNGGQITDQIKQWSKEGIETFREMLAVEKPNARLILDVLVYQSELVNHLSNGQSIEFKMDYASTKAAPLRPAIPVHGYFTGQDDIKALCDVLLNENLKYYGDRYY